MPSREEASVASSPARRPRPPRFENGFGFGFGFGDGGVRVLGGEIFQRMRLGNVVSSSASPRVATRRETAASRSKNSPMEACRVAHTRHRRRGFGLFCVGNVRDERADEFHGDVSVSRDEDAARGVQSCAEALYAVDVAHGDGDASRRGDVMSEDPRRSRLRA